MQLEPEHTTFPGHRVRDRAAKHARVHVSERATRVSCPSLVAAAVA
jgi:hypothetical protein